MASISGTPSALRRAPQRPALSLKHAGIRASDAAKQRLQGIAHSPLMRNVSRAVATIARSTIFRNPVGDRTASAADATAARLIEPHDCVICLEKHDPVTTSHIQLSACGHSFCATGMRAYIASKVRG